MNKKLKIIIGAAVLVIIIVLAFFFWQNWPQKQEGKLGYVQFDSFVKQETNGQVWYENKDAGIKFMVPDGWNINASQLASIALTSPDFKPFNDKPSAASIPSTGCWIGVSVKNTVSDDADYAITRDRLSHQDILSSINTSKKTYTVIDVGRVNMLKTSLTIDSNKDNVGSAISLELAQDNKFYSIETNLFGKDQEKCSQLFDEFLATVLIQ
jgi:hypothetical protein